MLVKVLKPFCYDDAYWNVGSILEVEPNTANYLVGMQVLVQEVTDAPLSARPDYGPERRTLETVAMDKAAAAIVGAVEKASKRHPLLDKEEDKPSKGKHE